MKNVLCNEINALDDDNSHTSIDFNIENFEKKKIKPVEKVTH